MCLGSKSEVTEKLIEVRVQKTRLCSHLSLVEVHTRFSFMPEEEGCTLVFATERQRSACLSLGKWKLATKYYILHSRSLGRMTDSARDFSGTSFFLSRYLIQYIFIKNCVGFLGSNLVQLNPLRARCVIWQKIMPETFKYYF